MQDIQYQERTETLSDRDVLKKLPQLIDVSTLTEEQQEVLRLHKQKTDLLEWLYNQEIEQRKMLQRQKDFSVSSQDMEQTKLRSEILRKNISSVAEDLLLFEKVHSCTIKSLVQVGWPIIDAEEREKSRQLLEEWRRQRDAKLNAVPAPITDNLRISVSAKSADHTPKSEPQTKGGANIKEKLANALGSVGIALWYLLSIVIAVMPLVMIGTSFWLNLLFLAVVSFIPATSGIFWIWGLVCAIRGPQDTIANIYYVLFLIMFLPYFIKSVLNLFRKRK